MVPQTCKFVLVSYCFFFLSDATDSLSFCGVLQFMFPRSSSFTRRLTSIFPLKLMTSHPRRGAGSIPATAGTIHSKHASRETGTMKRSGRKGEKREAEKLGRCAVGWRDSEASGEKERN